MDHSTAAFFFTDLEVVWLAPPGAAQRPARCFCVFLIVSGRETKGIPRVKPSTEGHQEMCKM